VSYAHCALEERLNSIPTWFFLSNWTNSVLELPSLFGYWWPVLTEGGSTTREKALVWFRPSEHLNTIPNLTFCLSPLHDWTDSFSSEPVKDLATRPTPAPGSRQREIPRCYALPRRPTAHSIEKRAPFHSNKRESRCVEETKIAPAPRASSHTPPPLTGWPDTSTSSTGNWYKTTIGYEPKSG